MARASDLAGRAAMLARILAGCGRRLAVAESCTGGLLAAALTARPGASAWFMGGIVAYDNHVKEHLLGVSPTLLARQGAVSAETALAMARGVRRACKADFGLGITGIAGPGGATPGKPVGCVFLGFSGPAGDHATALQLEGNRQTIRRLACRRALEILIDGVQISPRQTR